MWLLITLCMGIILLLYIIKLISFDYWKNRGVPTATGCRWFFGHYKPILFQEKHIKTVVNEMYNEYPGAPAVGYFKLHTPGLLVRDPELVKTVLITEFSNFATNGFFIDKKYDFLAGSNPFFVHDAEWKTVRSHATAAITYAKIKWYLPRILAVGNELAKYVARNCDGGTAKLDVKDLTTRFTTDVLGNAICGVVNNSFADPDSLFARITREVCFETTVRDNLKDALQTAWPALSCLFQMSEYPGAPAVGYFKLHTPGLLVRDPELVKTVLITEFSNFATNGFFIDKKYDFLAGSNPFFVHDAEWKTVRSHATAAITYAKIKWYLPRILAVGNELAKYVARNCDGGTAKLDVKDLTTRFTTDVLGNAICGVVNNSFADPDSLFARITREVCFETTVRDNLKDALQTAWPALSCLFQMRFSTPTSEEQLLYVTRKVIEERAATGDRRNDLYQVAISMRENAPDGVFTDQYISSLVYTIMLDQYETSSIVIYNTLLALAWHPEIQDRLRKEIMDFKSKTKEECTVDDIENLKYLDMVFSETVRICSTVPVLSRECTNDCYIPVPGLEKPLKISKGTHLMIPTQSMHMDPAYYPDPDKFDPERFTNEEVAKRPKYVYLPFGEGPKRCLALRLATLQIKVAVMSLVEVFRIRPAGNSFPVPCMPEVFLISIPEAGARLHFEAIEPRTNVKS